MKRIILFSMPTPNNRHKLAEALFPADLKDKKLAYMPSDGHNSPKVYSDYWQQIANENQATFVVIDNMLPPESAEAEKIKDANILLISGGNTFELLNNLRKSKLEQAIKDFVKKDNFVLAGFSAGAIVLTPTIATTHDQNLIGITDLSGLDIVNFEIIPHYKEDKDFANLEEHKLKNTNEVRTIPDDGIIILNL